MRCVVKSVDRLDGLDLRLLACLQENNVQTADELAEQVGRSPSAVARRLRRLRSSGAIAAEVAVLAEKAAGEFLSAVVNVQFERHSPAEIREFKRRLCASPNVQVFFELAGPFDVLLIVVAADMDAYNSFARSLLEAPPVQRFETTFVKERSKASLALPLDQLNSRRVSGGAAAARL